VDVRSICSTPTELRSWPAASNPPVLTLTSVPLPFIANGPMVFEYAEIVAR
jgi:hypothetical protein